MTTKMKLAAAVICILYILVQTFQWWVFSQAPEGTDLLTEFLYDGEPISIVRSWLMLLSMAGLLYIHFVLSFVNYTVNRPGAILAFTGFFTFFLLEVALRSIELFYIQVQLPPAYMQGTEQEKQAILNFVEQFRQVQSALYFPLGISWMAGSLILAAIVPLKPAFNRLVKIAFYINGIRILLRSTTVYLGITLFPTALYHALYLPMVIVVFGLSSWWFIRSVRHDRLPAVHGG